MKRRKLLLFCLLALNHYILMGQHNIHIQVLDKDTERAIIAAEIKYASNARFDNPMTIQSDAEGKAVINIPEGKNCYYRVRMMGYIPVEGKAGADTAYLTIYMKEDVLGLDEIVVTGSRTPHPYKQSPVTTQVLSGQALVNAGYTSLQQALQQETPGFNIRKVGFGNEISMQGLDARHVLFLMDGERMTGDMAGNLDYERFNLHAIDRIEIVKGASSTLYGSRASGAVINLITKKTDKPMAIGAGIRYAQRNEHNYKHPSPQDFHYMFEKNADRPNLQTWVSGGIKKGKITTQTDIGYSTTDAYYLYQAENDRKVYKKEANPFLDHDLVVVSPMPRSPMGIEGEEHISASQKIYYEPSGKLKIQAYGTLFSMNTYDLIQDLVFTQSSDMTGGLKAQYTFKDWVSLTASYHTDYYDRYKRHERRDERQKVYKSRIQQPRLTLTSGYFSGHSLIFGLEHFNDELTSDRFVNRRMTSRSLKETEYYLQDEWEVNPEWMLSAGVRTNFSRQFGFMGMPKIAAKYSPGNHISIRANYSMGYRSPSIKELFFNWDHLGMFQIKGNEYLQPEKNNYFSAGIEYTNDRLYLSTTLYGNFFRDKIEGVWKIYDMQYNFEYTNLSSQRMLGGESLARWRIYDYLTLNATYSYVNVSKQDGVKINNTSPHAATAGMEYRLRKKNYTLTANFTASFMGQKKFDVQDRVYVPEEGRSRDAYFRCELPSYALCNLSVMQIFANKIKMTIGIDNIFNYKPKTLGSGVTMFNIPSTPGARGFVQVEFIIDEALNALKRKK